MRAKLAGCPSSSVSDAVAGKPLTPARAATVLDLPSGGGAPLPPVHLLDLRGRRRGSTAQPDSRALRHLARRQSLLFLTAAASPTSSSAAPAASR